MNCKQYAKAFRESEVGKQRIEDFMYALSKETTGLNRSFRRKIMIERMKNKILCWLGFHDFQSAYKQTVHSKKVIKFYFCKKCGYVKSEE